jgi:hypothetical protein
MHVTVLSVNVYNGKYLSPDNLILKRSSPSFVMLTCSLNNCIFAKHMVTMFPDSCLRASIVDIITLDSTEVTVCSMTVDVNFQ